MNLLAGVVRFDGGDVAEEELTPLLSAVDSADTPQVERLQAAGACFALGRLPGGAGATLERIGERGLRLADGAAEGNPSGPFATAEWDGNNRLLALEHDFFARRGLYWARDGERLVFASEAGQVLTAVRGTPAIDGRRLLAYLLGAAPRSDWSFFRGVQRLPEGARLEATAQGERLVAASLSPASLEGDAAEELVERLDAAVTDSAPAGEPVSILLSGGLDSSAVAGLAARAGERPLAVTWSGGGLEEISAAIWEGRLETETLAADDLWPLSDFPAAYCDPNAPAENTFPELLRATLARLRSLGRRLLLNGLGGDPVAGWALPDLALLLRGRFASLLARWRRGGWRAVPVLRPLRAVWRRRLPSWLSPEGRALARDWKLDRPPLEPSDMASAERFRRSQLRSFANAVMAERLERLSRRSGVRLEAPWLDVRLAAWSLAVENCALAMAPPTKGLVRRAFAGLIPQAVLASSGDKGGAPTLVRRGLLERGRERVEKLLAESRLAEMGLVHSSRVLRDYRERADRGSILPGLWKILTAEAWLRAAPASS